MDRLTEMAAFVQVVDSGGFTEAARRLGVSKSAVSKHVSALEARLAVRLLDRTTRRVGATEMGRAYYERARAVLVDAAEADSMVTAMQAVPHGSLRVSAPVSFGIRHVSTAGAAFLCAHRQVDLDIVLDDRFTDLMAEGFDAAIRIGQLPDSALMARKLAETRLMLVASPAYLAQAGVPAQIEDLAAHRLLHYSNLATGSVWRLRTRAGEERQLRVGGRMTVNNGDMLVRAAEAGLGIALQPSFMLGAALAGGALVEVLPDRAPDVVGIYAVYPEGRFPQPKLRAFVDFMADHFRGMGPDGWLG